jgi:peptidoglycan/LPS O-acetylase OafA/YrhL
MGPVWFLMASVAFTVGSRYLFFGVLEVSGNYGQGAFFGGRLWEFSAGMVLAFLYRQHPSAVEDGFFSKGNLVLGLVLYAAGVYSYQPNFLCTLTDGLSGMGLFIILAQAMRWLACAVPWVGSVLTTVGVYSYGLYLLHQPYVITFGRFLSAYSLPVFVFCAAGVMLAITLLSIFIEKQVNRISARILDRPKTAQVTS